MRILFIDPLGDKESSGLNLGIAYCATSAAGKGHTASVLDLVNIRKADQGLAIKTAVKSFNPDCIGISVTNMSFNNSKSYTDGLKEYFKGSIILGGPEVSALAGRALELMPNADMAVIGEGEITLVELLDAMERGSSLGPINGLAWRDGSKVTVNPAREFINDVDGLPLPDYNIFGVDKMDTYPIITARGCPYGCIFCFSHMGKKWRARSPENIIEEIRVARDRYGAKSFHVCDASFNVDIERVKEFCALLIKEKLDIPWVIQGFRADRVTEEMIRMLDRANCRRIWVGIETLDEDIFKNIRKGETIQDIKRGIALMKKYNIEIYGYMLMGLPGDTFKKTLSSFNKARKLNLHLLAYSSCVPFTGTGMEKWTRANAVILKDSYNISSIGSRYDGIAFETKDFTREERMKARRLLNIKSGSYDEPSTNLLIFKFKKWLFTLRYDPLGLWERLKQSVAYRRQSINQKRGIYFRRLPDGTWGTGKGEVCAAPPRKRLYLDLKRLTISEVDAQ